MLELDREIEGSGNIDPLDLATLDVRTTRSDLIRPEIEARSIRFAIKEIEIVLANEKDVLVHRIEAARSRYRK